MQKQDIEMYLANLGQELQDLGVTQPVRVLLVGGAFMLTQVRNSRANTNDVDVLLKDIDDTGASPVYRMFKVAARAVASKYQLPITWINDVIGDFIRDASMVPQGTLWRRYAMLEVYVPPAEYILALKLLAGRRKDKADIRVLCDILKIVTREQAQRLVDVYIPDTDVQQINELDDTLDEFF